MPPKRKAAKATKAGGKKAKTTAAVEEDKPATTQDVIAKLKASEKKSGNKKRKVDSFVPLSSSYEVFEDYDCMLNQTNIGHNNNKYYVIQVLKKGASFYAWNRWGRVGESGANAMKGPFGSSDPAIKDFTKKFQDKTRNKWVNKDSFNPIPGKYTMIEMSLEDEDETDAPAQAASKSSGPTEKCTLDAPTQDLLKLIFNHDMFKDAMKSFDIDVKKMPLGKLSKTQLAKGFEVLEELEQAVDSKNRKKMMDLSSRFYTVIPHDFGRKIPPVIDTLEIIRQKYDMLLVLGDIEIAQTLEKEKEKIVAGSEKQPHPLDVNYGLLKCNLDLVDPKSKDYKVLETYTRETGNKGGWRVPKIKHIWSMKRGEEEKRFKQHEKISNRKLLWHGTNVAVVAAILKGGLRIMPHSGGRVGSGIYFASENSKSAGYVRCAGNTGIMFLNEVALGKEHIITNDDWTLKSAPAGYDCIIAKGWTEPDPKKDVKLKLGGKDVVVPQGVPVSQSQYNKKSSFDQSEYLIYKESQNMMRYLVMVDF
ncbi:protein mono-ADP-ribosyltransferase PARP3-like isoform X1 [Ostrea edulis]|uniref:protein mono-ADP-ribosyltransferase PARP3-like isoform X1 n=1 Tax=Ostrea edulis TaxID=37623 RepID=UPI002094CA9C|nr:protein mono-ADP-ribosyltransferase PARP3-like isoform X1 [Ostrea edulis]